MKTIRLLVCALATLALMPLDASAQAKKPTIMVIPADVWCTEHGFTETFEYQGRSTRVSDYERALQEDMDLLNVITKVGELMADRGFPLKDLSSTVRSINHNFPEVT